MALPCQKHEAEWGRSTGSPTLQLCMTSVYSQYSCGSQAVAARGVQCSCIGSNGERLEAAKISAFPGTYEFSSPHQSACLGQGCFGFKKETLQETGSHCVVLGPAT